MSTTPPSCEADSPQLSEFQTGSTAADSTAATMLKTEAMISGIIKHGDMDVGGMFCARLLLGRIQVSVKPAGSTGGGLMSMYERRGSNPGNIRGRARSGFRTAMIRAGVPRTWGQDVPESERHRCEGSRRCSRL